LNFGGESYKKEFLLSGTKGLLPFYLNKNTRYIQLKWDLLKNVSKTWFLYKKAGVSLEE